ncbi:hypothetical protein Tco_0583292 [Tanacetum coccineum]
MAERTMEELLRAPTKGYGEAIVLPEINADHFEIKTNLLQLVQANAFYGRENDNPHAHINSFKRITSTLRFRNVPNDVIKLMMFPYSLEGAAKTWSCLNDNKQDSLNAAAGGNLLSKTTREALNIIENKSKVRYSRNKPNASRINATSSKTDERIDKLADQLSTLVEIVSKKVVTLAPVKAVEESCVTCGGAHSWYNCPATDNNQASVCATTGTYNQVNPSNRVSQNHGQNRFNQNHVQGNNFNRGNNFHGNQDSDDQIPEIKLRITWRRSSRIFKILASTLVSRMLYFLCQDLLPTIKSLPHGIKEKTMKVFMDDFSVFEDSFDSCLSNLEKMLKRCEDTNFVLNWEKCHFMCRERIVLGHKISKSGIEVDRAKVDVIAKLPHPTTVKGVRSFLGHAGFYRRFIQDFSKIARPMTHLLEKETPFVFSKDCIDAFQTLKKKLTEAPILVVPD